MKILQRIAVMMLGVMIFSATFAVASQTIVRNVYRVNYNISIDGKQTNNSSYQILSKDHVTYVPLRYIAENLNAEVTYNQGEIIITSGKPSQNVNYESQSEKIQALERRVALVDKENQELKKQLEEANTNLDKKNMYTKLPAVSEVAADALKISVLSLTNSHDRKTSLNVSYYVNPNSIELFHIMPRETTIVINGQEQKIENFDAKMYTTLAPDAKNGATNSIDAAFEIPYIQNLNRFNGYIKIYYSVFNENTIRSRTIYFES